MAEKILGVKVERQGLTDILYKIKKYLLHRGGFFHIVSLNPENLVIAFENENFKRVLNTAQIRIIDGVGIVIAGKILGIEVGERVAGVDLMKKLIAIADEMRLRVLLIGGQGNLADNLANCYQKKFPKAKFLGIEGIKDIKKADKKIIKEEEKALFTIVSSFKPHLVFVAFGSPYQELWIERHKRQFEKCVVMGVGGAFDFLAGKVPRAPRFFQKLGLEWLFRLMIQPWRWRRQMRLIKFSWLIVLLIFGNIKLVMGFITPENFFRVSKELMINITAGWFGLITIPFILGEFKNYPFILTKGLILFILGVLISFWLTDRCQKL